MLVDAIKWLSMAQVALTYVKPFLEMQMKAKGEAPEWLDDVFDLFDQITENAKAGVAFDAALAKRIENRLKALPEKPTKADFEALATNIRSAYADFKSVMAARRQR